MTTNRTSRYLLLVLLALGFSGTVWADGIVDLGGADPCEEEEGAQPEGEDDCGKAEAGGEEFVPHCPPSNPACGIFYTEEPYQEGDDIVDLLNALNVEIGGTVAGETIQFDGSSYSSLCVRENSPKIPRLSLTNTDSSSDLNAKIRKVKEQAAGGSIDIVLNYTFGMGQSMITVATQAGQGPLVINGAILAALNNANYVVINKPNYFVITADPSGESLEQVSFQSTDPGIYISEVALEVGEADATSCDPDY